MTKKLFDQIEQNLIYTEGRKMQPNELTARAVLSAPEYRIQALQALDRELERDDLSIRDRAEVLSEKAKLNLVHQNMLRVGR